MEVSDARQGKALREENARLKKEMANLSLDKDTLALVIRKGLQAEAERLRVRTMVMLLRYTALPLTGRHYCVDKLLNMP